MNNVNYSCNTSEALIELPEDLWHAIFLDTDSELRDVSVKQEPVGQDCIQVKTEPVYQLSDSPAASSRIISAKRKTMGSACALESGEQPKRIRLGADTGLALTTGYSEGDNTDSSSSDAWLFSDADESVSADEKRALPRASLFHAEPLCATKLHDTGRYSDGMVVALS